MTERVQAALKSLQDELWRDDSDKCDWLRDAIDELIQARVEQRLGLPAESAGRGLHTKAVYVVNRENNAAWSAMLKLAKNCKPGAIIPVTGEEFEAIRDGLVVVLPPPPENGV